MSRTPEIGVCHNADTPERQRSAPVLPRHDLDSVTTKGEQ